MVFIDWDRENKCLACTREHDSNGELIKHSAGFNVRKQPKKRRSNGRATNSTKS